VALGELALQLPHQIEHDLAERLGVVGEVFGIEAHE